MRSIATLDKRRIATVLVVLLIAFLTGHVMQTVLADKDPIAAINEGPDAAPVLRSGEEPRPLPTPPAATLMPILERPPILPERVAEPLRLWKEASSQEACGPELTAHPSPAATVTLRLKAPCLRDMRVRISQGPIAFEGRTDRNGHFEVRVPALAENPEFEFRIGDVRLIATVSVPDASSYQHVALQWNGPQVLKMHAYEFGAERNQFGHVWSGAPKSPVRASRGSGGFLTRLGLGVGASVEIYSFPAGQVPTRGVVRLVVEADVTQANCGKNIRAIALQSGGLGRLSPTEVELAMPECDEIGQIVRLQNLLQDMRLAGR